MPIYLVRHARAGKRREWHDDDARRPLESDGVRQAVAIASRIADRGLAALLSSPYVRCMQTLEPLSLRTGLPIVADERLAEGADPLTCVRWMADLEEGSVLCSHGDVIPDVIDALIRRGMRVHGDATVSKGCVWTIEREDGEFASARSWLAPRSG